MIGGGLEEDWRRIGEGLEGDTGGATVFAPPTGFGHLFNINGNPPVPIPTPKFQYCEEPTAAKQFVRESAWVVQKLSHCSLVLKTRSTINIKIGGGGLMDATRLGHLGPQDVGGAKTVAPPVALQRCCVQSNKDANKKKSSPDGR